MKPDVSYVLAFNILQSLANRIKALYTQNVVKIDSGQRKDKEIVQLEDFEHLKVHRQECMHDE